MRTATFLEPKGNERMNVFEAVKRAYRTRSKVIHGGGAPSSGELSELVSQMEDIVSRAIGRIIVEHTTESLDVVCQSIDNQILQ